MIRIMSPMPTPLTAFEAEHLLPGAGAGFWASAQRMQAKAGRRLFRSGARPEFMHAVQHGEAVMQRVTRDGAVVVLQRAGPGDWLAEASLTSPRYHCDGICRTDCLLIRFPVQSLRRAIDDDAATRWAWIARLSAQTRQQRLRTERLALKTIRDRLHHLVLTEGDARLGLAWPGTRLALAADLGVTPEALYRALPALQAEGVLVIDADRLRWQG